MANPVLRAVYSAPDHAPFTASRELPASTPAASTDSADSTDSTTSPTAATAQKTSYLCALRVAVAAVQDDINRELTARMVLDVEAAAGRGGPSDKAALNEEEQYGEEAMDDA